MSHDASANQPSKLLMDIVRIKKLPQSEDEPLPCSAAIRITCLETPEAYSVVSDVQRGTNNPYYNQTVEREIPSALSSSPMSFLVEVIETARSSNPTIILYAAFAFDGAAAAHATTKTELSLYLTVANPLSAPAVARQQEADAAKSSDAPTVVIRYKLTGPKIAKPVYDPNADVILDRLPELTGDHRLVPQESPLAWMNLVMDPAWCEKFSFCIVETWKGMPSLAAQIRSLCGVEAAPSPKKPAPKSASGTRGGSAAAAASGAGGAIKTVGDVILTQWCCKRHHQLISRLRLTAEKFVTGDESIAFTLEEDIAWKRYWKERAVLRAQQCRKCFDASGSTDKLRLMLDRLWMLMAAGIPAEGPAPTLGFDVRHKLSQFAFTTVHAETLQACLLQRLAPWIPYSTCEAFCQGDSDPRTIPSAVRNVAFPPLVTDPKTANQIAFVDVLSMFVGRIIDTLTDTEFSTALEYFIPAIREAHMRSASSSSAVGGKSEIERPSGSAKKKRGGSAKKKKAAAADATADVGASDAAAVQGAGVSIKHLDNLGRRVDATKFA